MNHRWSMRKSLVLDVDLVVGDGECRRGRTRNVSLGGLFVECEPVSTVDRYTPVEMRVKLAEGESADGYRLKGEVRHSSDQGIGVAFRDFTIDDMRALQQVL